MTSVELAGYLASALVVLSFLMKSMTVLRVVNTIGCATFIVYGLLLDSWPVVLTNGSIILINLFYLFVKPRMQKS